MGPEERVWRFIVVVPVEEIKPIKRQIATFQDLRNLEEMFPRHFGGLTLLPPSTGYGMWNPMQRHRPPELNYNMGFMVYTSPVPEAKMYFQALQKELQTALDEGVILVERQEVWLV